MSIQFICSVVSDSLQPHGLQHTRPPCPSPTPGTYSNSCPLRWWCRPTISSSVIPFSSCFKFFPVSGSVVFPFYCFPVFFCISITTNNLFHSLNTEFKKCQGFNVRVSSLLYIYKILCEVGRFIFPLKPPLPFSVWHTYSRISVTVSTELYWGVCMMYLPIYN